MKSADEKNLFSLSCFEFVHNVHCLNCLFALSSVRQVSNFMFRSILSIHSCRFSNVIVITNSEVNYQLFLGFCNFTVIYCILKPFIFLVWTKGLNIYLSSFVLETI